MNWVWYCNYAEDSKELRDIMTDDDGKRYHNAMPIGKVRASVWDHQKEVALQTLPPMVADLVRKTAQPFTQTINDVRSPRASFFYGKLLLVGDALAGFRPHAPASTEQAAVDAFLLERLMKNEISKEVLEEKALRYSHVAALHARVYGLYWQYGFTAEFWITLMQFGGAKVVEWARGKL